MSLSVALAVGLPRLAVSQHRTLWRADFPRTAEAARDRPVDLDAGLLYQNGCLKGGGDRDE